MKIKDSMHLPSERHPFQGNGRTPAPKTAKSAACHPTAAGGVGKFKSANAAMKSK